MIFDVYNGLYMQIPTLSRTTVYNTLRMFSEHKAAQMITIDEHRVCYDGLVTPQVHFLCRICGMVINMMGQKVFDQLYGDSHVVISTTDFAPGTYSVTVTTHERRITKQVIVK